MRGRPNGLKEKRGNSSKCRFHDNAEHWTDECKLYLSKPTNERKAMLKEKSACWSCLRIGHRQRDCKKKRTCGVNDCSKTHHRALHEETQTTDAPNPPPPAPTNACKNPSAVSCLLLLQRIPTRKNFVNVLWDNGASLCFLTNEKAREERLKGTRIDLSIVKVGGANEKLPTYKYKLPLIDEQGQEVLFNVYGIGKITSDIQAVNLDGVTNLLNVSREEITRPIGSVDVLIGYEYAGFHPEKEQSSGHLCCSRTGSEDA